MIDTSRPVVLDLFCGVGGATAGYQAAGFQVIGVDIAAQPDYCGGQFTRGDAVDYLTAFLREPPSWIGNVAIHASPPCQSHSALGKGTNGNSSSYPDFLEPIRELCIQSGLPYVIENVVGAPLCDPITLCGEMFGLDVIRHRRFESNIPLSQPEHVRHRGRVSGMRHGVWYEGPYAAVYGDGGGKGSVARWQEAMGISWTANRKSIAEAIPPAFTKHVGQQLMAYMVMKAVGDVFLGRNVR